MMLLNMVVVIGSALLWLALLWFGKPVNFSTLNPVALFSLLALPPLALGIVVGFVRKQREKHAAQKEANRSADEEVRRTAAKAQAEAEHIEKMAQRRFYCDCRAIAVTGTLQHSKPELEMPSMANMYWVSADADLAREADDPLLGLQLHLEEALSALYEACPAAYWLPHWVCPPADASGEVLLTILQQSAHQAAQQVVGEDVPERIHIRYLPEATHTADRLLGLFEADPELPAAVVIGLDSPFIRAGNLLEDEFDEVPDASELEHKRWFGAPSQAVAVLLLTAQSLVAQTDDLIASSVESNQGEEVDIYTPYWEKDHSNQTQGWLNKIPAMHRPSLVQTPILASLHRGASRQSEKPLRGLEMAAYCQAILDRALVNANLRDLPFGETTPIETAPLSERCRWLVHHAGGIERGGTRLAALGNALNYFAIDLDPIEEASNTVLQFGNVGRALPILLAAVTLAKAATLNGAFCAEFMSDSEVAGYIALAPNA